MDQKDDRLFAMFAIEMDEHPKIIGLSDAAFRALFEATFYARRLLTDGFLDERVVLRRWGQEVADELSANDHDKPSWVRVDRGWLVHDWAKHHPMRADIDAKRADVSEKRRQAGRKGAAKRWQDDGKPVAKDGSETDTEPKTKKEPSRGTRVPDSFQITEEMREWGATNTPLVDLDQKLDEWLDYWRGVPGQKGVKIDWVGTWRNGMRKQQQFAERDAPKPQKRNVRRFNDFDD